MKKILISLSIVAAVAAVVVTATTAFFSDEETSAGNTFTAGEIDLTVDDTQFYNGNECVKVPDSENDYIWQGNALFPKPGTSCNGSWAATDLGGQKFFDFADVKPGDSGVDIISLHVDNNEAWMCADFNTTSSENELVEPELSMDPADTENFGELSKYMEIMWWKDSNGNGKLDNGETPLYEGPRTLEQWLAIGGSAENHGNGSLLLTISDSQVNALGEEAGTPVEPNSTFNIAVAWCLGDLAIDTNNPNGYSCDGELVLNDAQTDRVEAALNFEVVQSRNNSPYLCAEHRDKIR